MIAQAAPTIQKPNRWIAWFTAKLVPYFPTRQEFEAMTQNVNATMHQAVLDINTAVSGYVSANQAYQQAVQTAFANLQAQNAALLQQIATDPTDAATLETLVANVTQAAQATNTAISAIPAAPVLPTVPSSSSSPTDTTTSSSSGGDATSNSPSSSSSDAAGESNSPSSGNSTTA